MVLFPFGYLFKQNLPVLELLILLAEENDPNFVASLLLNQGNDLIFQFRNSIWLIFGLPVQSSDDVGQHFGQFFLKVEDQIAWPIEVVSIFGERFDVLFVGWAAYVLGRMLDEATDCGFSSLIEQKSQELGRLFQILPSSRLLFLNVRRNLAIS